MAPLHSLQEIWVNSTVRGLCVWGGRELELWGFQQKKPLLPLVTYSLQVTKAKQIIISWQDTLQKELL